MISFDIRNRCNNQNELISLTRSRTSNLTSGSFPSFSLESRFSACFRNSIFFLLDRKYTVSRVNTQIVSFSSYPNSQFYISMQTRWENKIKRNYWTSIEMEKTINFTTHKIIIMILLLLLLFWFLLKWKNEIKKNIKLTWSDIDLL